MRDVTRISILLNDHLASILISLCSTRCHSTPLFFSELLDLVLRGRPPMVGAHIRHFDDYLVGLKDEERRLKGRVYARERKFKEEMEAFKGTDEERRKRTRRHEAYITQYKIEEKEELDARLRHLKEKYDQEQEAKRQAREDKRQERKEKKQQDHKPPSSSSARASNASQSSNRIQEELLRTIEEAYRRIKEEQLRKLEQIMKEMEEAERQKELREKEREQFRIVSRFVAYENGWLALAKRQGPLRFIDIPWPVLPEPGSSRVVTKEAVRAFFSHPKFYEQRHWETPRRRLRSELLRWHTDKFRAAVLQKVREEDRMVVEELGEMVVRVLTDMKERK